MTTHSHRRLTSFALTAALGAALLAPSAARADQVSSSVATADALFQSAQTDLDAGQWDLACPKFERSMTLDPAVSTLLNIAKCHDHDGKLTLAWSALQRAVVMNRDTADPNRKAALDKYTREAIVALEPRLPYLTIRVMGEFTGLELQRDGVKVDLSTLGQPIPVDPGQHLVVAEAPGYATQRVELDLVEGKRDEARIALTQATPASSELVPPAAEPGPDASAPTSSRAIPVWVWPVGGAGVALIATGAYFTTQWASTRGDLEDKCPGFKDCTGDKDEINPLVTKVNTSAGLAIGLGAAGVVAVGAAVVGILTAKPKQSPGPIAWTLAPWAAPTGGGLVSTGTF